MKMGKSEAETLKHMKLMRYKFKVNLLQFKSKSSLMCQASCMQPNDLQHSKKKIINKLCRQPL